MRILALTRYERLGSSSRVRFYQYFPFLESQGVDIVSVPFFDNDYVRSLYAGKRASIRPVILAYLRRISTLISPGNFDLLWIEKELLPWFPAPLESLFRARDIPYVVDYDDAVFHRYDQHSLALVRAVLGKKIDDVMRNAKIVVVGNEYLAERARKAGPRRVETLPSVVDVDRYVLKEPGQGSTFNIGWIGSPLNAGYIGLIHESIRQLSQESEVRLVLVGAGTKPATMDVPTEVISWSEDSELRLSQNMDVGIMPLIDEPFERGKCGYKLIQYMAGGIPVVASPVGVNREIVEHEVNGYLAESPHEWLQSLRSLRDDVEKRTAMGRAGHQKAKKLYNLEVTAPQLFNLLSDAVNK